MAPIDDLRAECDDLYAFVADLPASDWRRPTIFWSWTTNDEILHLYYVDLYALTSATDPTRFAAMVAERRADAAAGVELSQRVRERLGHLARPEVLKLWRDQYLELCGVLAARDPKERVAWFGPDMSIVSLLSARQMEVWAHGQDVYDLFAVHRRNTDRIRNICEIGVRTYGWTFDNRGLPRPGPPPAVTLTGPSGALWRWNEGGQGSVEGSAEDFALVVTQRRHVNDTQLRYSGGAAHAWMLMAQCFAGPPADPPAPGERVVAAVIRQ